MDKKKYWILIMFIVAAVAWIGTVIWDSRLSFRYGSLSSDPGMETFAANANVSVNEDRVGAGIWLKQAIHGMDGIKYRYVVKTDCPSWDFETRYMSDEPIGWVNETSAVEVLIYDAQVRYNGTVYASGQYYTVPILGGISSEDTSLAEWQDSLVKQAYQAYTSEMGMKTFKQKAVKALSWLLVFLMLALSLEAYMVNKKEKAGKQQDTRVR